MDNEAIQITSLIGKWGLAPSNGEARRMVYQGAVRINGVRVTDVQEMVPMVSGTVVKVGRRMEVI
ncbi:tyrosyl-tRNA synthetase [Marininema halotolerans]|uniref:Tyrosyl-tRNA synthetase n=2 Tax=Marininema halotolerans TaxID=1155944 RepID=A0A1I6USB1_9BACL|nr:S4 domain-containing protein [Marininema halotolerans]SFT04227.1 tyrosyl-tRNA synthetase [Marininema halotolerans]